MYIYMYIGIYIYIYIYNIYVKLAILFNCNVFSALHAKHFET